MEKKSTKKEQYQELLTLVVGNQDLIDFINHEIELLDRKHSKAAERAAKKKTDGDELRAAVVDVLTEELQAIDEIVEKVNIEGASRSKIVSRLTQLAKADIVEKESIKVGDRKVMAYRLAGATSVEEDATDDEVVE